MAEAIPQAVGGAAGFVYGGPAGATAGAYGAGKILNPLIERVYGHARANVMNLLVDAVHDPEFARELMQNAPTARIENASPRLRNYLATRRWHPAIGSSPLGSLQEQR